tara:strand:+ start:87 stop:809 length:723 start_codon:yes stop_codon:yes gene_type:complete
MPNVTLNPIRDGKAYVTAVPDFLTAQGLASGSGVSANPTNSSPSFGWSWTPGRGGGTQTAITRYFMYFDTSAYTTTITNPKIEVRGYGVYGNSNPIIVKADRLGDEAFDGGTRDLEVQDFSRYSANAGDLYGSNTHTFTSGWNSLALDNSTFAATAISESSAFCICILDGPSDYSKRTPGAYGDSYTGWWGGTSGAYKIRLHFTASASGWTGGKFLGIDATSIDKIIGVDRTDIDKVIGV